MFFICHLKKNLILNYSLEKQFQQQKSQLYISISFKDWGKVLKMLNNIINYNKLIFCLEQGREKTKIYLSSIHWLSEILKYYSISEVKASDDCGFASARQLFLTVIDCALLIEAFWNCMSHQVDLVDERSNILYIAVQFPFLLACSCCGRTELPVDNP